MLPAMSAWDEVAAGAEGRHGVVALAELLAAGMSRRDVERRVARGQLVAVGPTVWRIAGAPPSHHADVLGVLLGIEGEAWASHRTAARLWGIRVHGPAGLIEITRPYGTSANRGSVHIHRSTLVLPHHVTVHQGVSVTAVPRTIFDLARRTGPKVFDRAIEEALRAHLCTIGSLHRVLAELGGRGRPGTRKMRAALAPRAIDYVPTSSELTAVGRAVLASVPGIEWEVPITDEQGYIRQVDGLVRAARLIIELDGAAFHDQPSDVRRDTEQDLRLIALGYVVERVRWVDLTQRPEATLAKILRLVAGGAA